MPFSPLRILVVYDNARGHCGRVVPDMVERLEARAFQVDAYALDALPAELDPFDYAGLVLGTPTFGIGWKGVGPTQALSAWIKAQGGLDELRVACFTVAELRAGNTLRNLRQICLDEGAEVVVTHSYPLLDPERDAHVLPAECMVRIR